MGLELWISLVLLFLLLGLVNGLATHDIGNATMPLKLIASISSRLFPCCRITNSLCTA